jgi:hypothetical protein
MRAVNEIGVPSRYGWDLVCSECCQEATFAAGYHKVESPWACPGCKDDSKNNKERAMENFNNSRIDVLTDTILKFQQRAIRLAHQAKRDGNWDAFNRTLAAIEELRAERGPLAEVSL